MLKQDRAAKLRSRSSWPKVVVAAAVLYGAYYAWTSGVIGQVTALMSSAPHGRSHAERMVDGLLNTPECATYRKDILAYRNQPDTEAVRSAIDKIFRDGIAAGCKKYGLVD